MSRYCRPWWCLTGCRRFHMTFRPMCYSRRDRRAIRSIAATLPRNTKEDQ